MTEIYPPEHIIAQTEASLRRLETDCLDALLFQTWCPTWSEETAWCDTMYKLREQGKIRTFGISVSDHRPDDANGVIRAGVVDIIEAPFSILDQRALERLFPLAQEYHVNIVSRTPLASGVLPGHWYESMKFHRDDWRWRVFRGELLTQNVRRVDQVKSLVDLTLPLPQIALRFCLSHPAVSIVIPGVRNDEQVRSNFAACEQDPLPQQLQDHLTRLWSEGFQYNVRTSIRGAGEG
jgi:aryl-alcohol dehydrogenase-like predicted oxidoreductase